MTEIDRRSSKHPSELAEHLKSAVRDARMSDEHEHLNSLMKTLPTPKKEPRMDPTPLTGRFVTPLLAKMMLAAGAFDRKFYGQRRALAWTKKPPTNGAREVARRLRGMGPALFTVPA